MKKCKFKAMNLIEFTEYLESSIAKDDAPIIFINGETNEPLTIGSIDIDPDSIQITLYESNKM